MQRILVIGATSAIAEATLKLYAERGDALYLVARNTERLKALATDLSTRGAARVETTLLDVTDFDHHAPALDTAWKELGGIDVALIAHGSGAYDKGHLKSVPTLRAGIDTNATATIALMAAIGTRMAEQGRGTLAVITSVAGVRGRAANLLYGAAKAAVIAYASGLRQTLHRRGVQVVDIRPGWVDTPMTAHLKKGPLFAQPDTVARGIVRAIDRHRSVVHLPWIWSPLMLLIRWMPEPIWKRLRL
ncbi:MAG TPA: SDR family NAD(P)-dependent oxidoreductase [Rhodanobacteraceae bacterium]|nr:SDR family NAD(P)-dependent oxidoreductase [Rhodanobacteraceae bacterium]